MIENTLKESKNNVLALKILRIVVKNMNLDLLNMNNSIVDKDKHYLKEKSSKIHEK